MYKNLFAVWKHGSRYRHPGAYHYLAYRHLVLNILATKDTIYYLARQGIHTSFFFYTDMFGTYGVSRLT